VWSISECEIKKSFGSQSKGGYTNCYGGSACYMLMYRKIDQNNLKEVSDESVPKYIKEFAQLDKMEKQNKKEQDKKKQEEAII
jgi:hypothetical protein